MKTSTGFATIEARSTYQGSCKRHLTGSRPDLNVPYREVSLSAARLSDRVEQNPPLPLYDTSGPYTDPEARIDLTRRLPPLRATWIEDRPDTKKLIGPSSEYARLRQDDLPGFFQQFPSVPRPRRALSGKNITQMHYARGGIVTPEIEFVALRESMRLDRLTEDPAYRSLLAQHNGQPFDTHIGNRITPEFVRTEVAAGRAIIPANNLKGPRSLGSELKVSWFNRPLWSGPSWIWRYGFAFLVIAATLFLSKLITPHFAFPGTLYLCAVMLSVWVGGLGPGLLASVLSTLACHYCTLLSPGPTLREMPRLFMVFLSNILIALVSAAQRSAKGSVKRTRDDLTETVKHLQRTNDALLTQSGEREQAENRLRRSEAYLAEAQRLTKTGSWAYDPATEKALYWSDEMFRIHGLDPQQGPPTSKAFVEHVHPDDRDGVLEAMLRVVREKTEYEVKHRMILPDGTIAHIHAHGHPVLDRSGDVVEVVGSAVDVTERNRFRELEANLAHLNRVSMMGELAAALAHEIKQPIAAAITNGNTSLRWLARDVPDLERARQAIARAVKDSTRGAEIVNHLRSFYKKGGQPQLEMVDLNEVVREMFMLLRDEAYRYSITMRTELAPELPNVKTDRVQLQQVFMNLMLNAIEAMKETAGELTVKSQLSDDGQVLISVNDTGVGLPAEKQEQIFDAFFTTKPQGTGMGLAITRSIIEAHKGRLWASANPGGGAIFHFTLPSEATASSASAD